MKDLFGHNFAMENLNSLMNDKMILRFLQDNFITNQNLLNQIDGYISAVKSREWDGPAETYIHNTKFSMCLKVVVFRFLYQLLKIEFLEQWPDGYWSDLVKNL